MRALLGWEYGVGLVARPQTFAICMNYLERRPIRSSVFGDDAVSSCMYTYSHSSEIVGGLFGASWSMVWEISWWSSVGVGEDLGEYLTTTDVDVLVSEIQAVIVG